MSLGLTQPLTEMSTRNVSWGKGGRCAGLTTLIPSCADCLEIWESQPPGTLWAFTGLQWDCFTFYRALVLWKMNLPDRGLTKVEKHCSQIAALDLQQGTNCSLPTDPIHCPLTLRYKISLFAIWKTKCANSYVNWGAEHENHNKNASFATVFELSPLTFTTS